MTLKSLPDIYSERRSKAWTARLLRLLAPPLLFIPNPREPLHYPLGRWNLYIGGAGAQPDGYVNIDLFAVPGVDVAADAERLPFRSAIFQCIECDAVLEHVRNPERVMDELERVLAPGGYIHVVTPFCHPFHAYPDDYRRFTPAGLRELSGDRFEVVAEGWRTGPTASLLIIFVEYVKLWFPGRLWRGATHFCLGWLLFPFRYLDLLLLRSPRAGNVGNHCYIWLRKPVSSRPNSG
ncbi:MAG: methyltransferase domain-containing protein [Bryobacteraceae bacterium]